MTYYRHEEYFWWVLVAIAFMVAFSSQGMMFVAACVLFSPFWIALVWLPWYWWRWWRFDKERQTNGRDG
jgi:hypothetical protein